MPLYILKNSIFNLSKHWHTEGFWGYLSVKIQFKIVVFLKNNKITCSCEEYLSKIISHRKTEKIGSYKIRYKQITYKTMKNFFSIILMLFISYHIYAQYDTIHFDDVIINKKYLLHTNIQGFPIKEEGKYQSFKWGDLVDGTILIPFAEKDENEEYAYEIQWDISFLYKEKTPEYIYIERISACRMYKIYFRIDNKLVCINKKNKNFFAKKFPKSYETYLKNQNQRYLNGFFIRLKKGNDYGYIKIHFKDNHLFEQISIHQKIGSTPETSQ